MRVVKKILKVFLFIVLVLLIFSAFIFTTIDRTPYQEMAYYQKMLQQVESVQDKNLSVSGDTIKVGWSKSSLIPSHDIPLAGFGNRRGKIMEGIRDSLWLRAFVFDNQLSKAIFVTMDLLIVPPEVELALKHSLKNEGFDPEHLYLSSTHSHSSIGAWGPGVAGEAIAGDFDPEIIKFISNAALVAIKNANDSRETAKIGYSAIVAHPFVVNRLVGEDGII
ncbi:MAG: neutral/alkaline non-lysosomal ceramidase N-terminal domain-containing protein, partial [Bacteroidota bacterium]|nr:neutral/alkaline non-lysosomal ceramidase N-terminal domain-containing protein [Bacteroidota bacterium]